MAEKDVKLQETYAARKTGRFQTNPAVVSLLGTQSLQRYSSVNIKNTQILPKGHHYNLRMKIWFETECVSVQSQNWNNKNKDDWLSCFSFPFGLEVSGKAIFFNNMVLLENWFLRHILNSVYIISLSPLLSCETFSNTIVICVFQLVIWFAQWACVLAVKGDH